jgi:NAD-dependent SIR2 family protein deacetylase
MPVHTEESIKALDECDKLIIIGTSLQIGYTVTWLKHIALSKPDLPIYYVDPKPELALGMERILYVAKPATEGIVDVINHMKENEPT